MSQRFRSDGHKSGSFAYSGFLVAVVFAVFLGTGVEASASAGANAPPPPGGLIEQASEEASLATTPGPTSRAGTPIGDLDLMATDEVGDTVYDYVDVPDHHFAALDIAALAADGILAGTDCQPGQFCPDLPIKRWVLAVWIVRVLDGSDPAVRNSRFEDIPGRPWWESYVERLAELRVTVGCGLDPLRFCPNDTVTRAQMAAFLDRAFDLPDAPDAGFIDTLGVFSKTSIDKLYQSGITRGCSNVPLRFCPNMSLTRAQMAAFLQRGRPPTLDSMTPIDDFGPDVSFYAEPLPGISNLVVSVHYCGPPNNFTEADLQNEIAQMEQVATFFRRESGNKSTVTFEKGDLYFPTEAMDPATWANESVTKWYGSIGNNPCYDAVFGDPNNRGSSSTDIRRISVIVADVKTGNVEGFGPPGGYLFRNIEPYVLIQTSTRSQSSTRFWLVAHEVGHSGFSLCHAFDDSGDCDKQGGDSAITTQCKTGVSVPDCGGNDRLEELAGSIMSYHGTYGYGSYTKLTDSYIACERKKWLGWSNGPCGAPAAPQAPALDPDDGRITVRWNPPSDNGWSPITGYYVGITRSGTNRGVAQIGRERRTTHGPFTGNGGIIAGLTNGVEYSVEVQAANSQGTGDWSRPSTAIPGARQRQLVPDVPSVDAVVTGSTVSASWSASDNGSPIDKWEIGGSTGEVGAGTTSFRWSNLQPGTYSVWVRAHNAAGWSEWGVSNGVTVREGVSPSPVAYDAGSAVRNRWNWNSATSQSHAECLRAAICRNVGVSNLSDFGGSPYQLECWTAGQSSAAWSGSWAGSSNSGCYYWGDQPMTVYVKINGKASNRLLLERPTLQRPDVPSVDAVVTGSTVSASWSASDNGSPIDKWEIGGSTGEVGAGTTSFRWSNLQPGTYSVWVRAHNAAGWSEWGVSNGVTVREGVSPSPVAYDAGSAVRNRWNWNSATSQSHAECLRAAICRNVGVSNLSDFGGSPYQLECWTAGQSSAAWSGSWAGSSNSGCYYWGDQPMTVYVKINGKASNRLLLERPTLQRPDVPSVDAVVTGSTVSASWSASDNGSPIDKWEIGGSTGEVGAGTTSFRWSNLQPGTYSVWVRAHNAAGWSEWGVSNGVTVREGVSPSPVAYDAGSAVRNRWNWNSATRSHQCLRAAICRNVGVSNLSDFGGSPYQLECWTAGQSSAAWSGSWAGRATLAVTTGETNQ